MLDLRVPLLRGETVRFVGGWLAKALQEHRATAVAGHGLSGALAAAAALAHAPALSARIVREKPKSHGRRRHIEGPDAVGDVVVVDDILHGGNTALGTVDALAAEGITVSGVLVVALFAWGAGARRLADAGLWVDHLVRLDRPDTTAP